MRGLGLCFGGAKRNDPVKLVDPHPVTNYGDDVQKGNAGLDGFTVLSKASPRAQGSPPPVAGAIGPAYQGPDQSFEQ
jgi:hypothetical protein